MNSSKAGNNTLKAISFVSCTINVEKGGAFDL